jgi:hypothetical protein
MIRGLKMHFEIQRKIFTADVLRLARFCRVNEFFYILRIYAGD